MKPVKLGLLGLVVTLVGGVSYPFLLDIPWIRSTAIPNLIVVALGSIIASAAVVKKAGKPTIAFAVISDAVLIFFLIGLFVLGRLPPPTGHAKDADTLPDFTLKNQDGRAVTLSSFRGAGPVLLVFYRGHW